MKKNRARPAWAQLAASQRGAAVVEFAIVCALLFMVVFGIIEFSIMLYDKAIITNASREGARAGVVYTPDRTTGSIKNTAETAAKLYCSSNLISLGSNATPTATATAAGINPGDQLKVIVTYRYTFLVFPNLSKIFGGSIGSYLDLSAQTIMRME